MRQRTGTTITPPYPPCARRLHLTPRVHLTKPGVAYAPPAVLSASGSLARRKPATSGSVTDADAPLRRCVALTRTCAGHDAPAEATPCTVA